MLPVQPFARRVTWPGTSSLRRRLRIPATPIPSLLWGAATRMFDTLSILLPRHSDGEDEKEGQHVDDGGLVGTDRTAGKLQVAVSGPTVSSWSTPGSSLPKWGSPLAAWCCLTDTSRR